jgi:hypothetical protein
MLSELLDNAATTAREGAESVDRVFRLHPPLGMNADEVAAHVAIVRSIAQLFRFNWKGVYLRLNEGVEERLLLNACADLRCGIEHWLNSVDLVQGWAETVGQSGGKVHGLPELLEEVKWAKEVQVAIGQVTALASAPRPPVDAMEFAEAQAAYEQGRYRSVADILAARKTRKPQ